MAISTEAANRVRQKTLMITRNPGVFYSLKALFLHLAANKGNPDLQYVNVDGTKMSSDGGAADQVIADAAANLFAIYLLQRGTTATTFKATDNASTGTSNGGQDVSYIANNGTTAEELLFLFPVGRTLANGLTLREDTTATGSVRTLKANRLDGFVIISAGLGN